MSLVLCFDDGDTQIAPDVVLYNVFASVMDSHELDVREELSRGAFGVVYRGRWQRLTVAVKRLLCDASGGNSAGQLEQLRQFCNEVHLMALLQHRNLVALHGVVAAWPPTLVMEFCGGGDLDLFTRTHSVAAVDNRLRLRLAHDVACGLTYMHAQTPSVAHRDLRSPNVFLVHANLAAMLAAPADAVCAKLGDFGLSRRLALRVISEPLETWTWMAPETRAGGGAGYDAVRADVFSFAMLLYHLYTHRLPYSEFDDVAWSVQKDIERHQLRPSLDLAEAVPAEVCELTRQCWAHEPTQRPTMEQVRSTLELMKF